MVEREHEGRVDLPELRVQSQDPLPSGDRKRGIICLDGPGIILMSRLPRLRSAPRDLAPWRRRGVS